MKILALDQASQTTGWSVWDGSKLVTYGKFTVAQPHMGDRLAAIRNHVQNLIDTHKPQKIIFEDIQLQTKTVNNVHTYRVLAEVIGMLETFLTDQKIPYEIMSSSTWKSVLSIKGKDRAEQKRNAQKWVTDTYAMKPTQDECDAICIGAAYSKNNVNSWE